MGQNHYPVAVTAIVHKDGKFLITKRSATKKRWPNMWTVPGGNMQRSDYEARTKETENAWYYVLEYVVRREVREETGIEIKNLEYLVSIIGEFKEGDPHILVISMMAEYAGGDIKLQEGECDEYAWVTAEEAKKYSLISGIAEEIEMAEKRLNGIKSDWQKAPLHA